LPLSAGYQRNGSEEEEQQEEEQRISPKRMVPNVKLLIEVVKQLHVEIKEGFASHEVTFTKRLDEVAAAEHIRDARCANLEEATASSDKALVTWRPEVDASITSVKLKLSKLNTFFSREAKTSSGPQQGILITRLAPTTASAADGPVGHHIYSIHRDCEFGCAFPQTHDPVKGTVHPTPPLPIFLSIWSFLAE
jgi:hypothetical protein